MKISKKQQEEIDFFSQYAPVPFTPIQEEKEEYIKETVQGIKEDRETVWQERNRISESKRGFDISIKMWRKDLVNGLLIIDELYEDFGSHPFGKRLMGSVLQSLNFSKYIPGEGYAAIALANVIRKKDNSIII